MAPMGVVPRLRSKLEGDPPKITGAPFLASCTMATPQRFSATCWTRVPEMVTRDVAPVIPIEISSEGRPARAESIRLWVVGVLHLRGGDGEASKMATRCVA